jgi:phage tail-like protein
MSDQTAFNPLPIFRFQVDFFDMSGGGLRICSGAFSECTGLEATMEPMLIREGGQNFGAAQRAGRVTFATVILKRGMTTTRHLWNWFNLVTMQEGYAFRLNAEIAVFDFEGNPKLKWKLARAVPIKFKAADLNALGVNVGIEELHLAHEGLSVASV